MARSAFPNSSRVLSTCSRGRVHSPSKDGRHDTWDVRLATLINSKDQLKLAALGLARAYGISIKRSWHRPNRYLPLFHRGSSEQTPPPHKKKSLHATGVEMDLHGQRRWPEGQIIISEALKWQPCCWRIINEYELATTRIGDDGSLFIWVRLNRHHRQQGNNAKYYYIK